jgi:hypothetical protein
MAAFLDVCRFNPTAGGISNWTYASPVPGYQNPASAGAVNGRLYKYRAESSDLSQWELGEGAYNTGTATLARTTVLFNSSGTTSKISFSTVPQVAIVALKEDLISVEEANSFTPAQQDQARQHSRRGGCSGSKIHDVRHLYAECQHALLHHGMRRRRWRWRWSGRFDRPGLWRRRRRIRGVFAPYRIGGRYRRVNGRNHRRGGRRWNCWRHQLDE